MVGLTGCTASAESDPSTSPTPSASGTAAPTATASPNPAASRPTISVQLNPDRVPAGETTSVWILAHCPVPTGGPDHTGTAASKAFVNGSATLDSVPAASVTPSPSASPAGASPWVRGEAQVPGTVRRGSYRVDVKCDGTNDLGRATLRVVAPPSDDDTPTGLPSRAPRAGGGGTYAQDTADESSIPLGPAGALVALALAAGVGIAIKRRTRA